MISLLIAFLILIAVVAIFAWIIARWILPNIPGVPPEAPRFVYAIAGIIVLVWLVYHVLPVLGVR